MREVFPENVSVITQFSLTLWLQSVSLYGYKVLGTVQKFIFLIFRGSYFQIAVAVSLTGAIS